MNPGIVLCSRINSGRIVNKPLQKINGITLIRLLLERLLQSDIPICVALPKSKKHDIIVDEIYDLPVKIYRGDKNNVFNRFYMAAKQYNYDPVIRVTHDDILIDNKLMNNMVKYHYNNQNDYTYVKECINGTGTEIVSFTLLEKAYNKYKDEKKIEHLSYVFKNESQKTYNYVPNETFFDTKPWKNRRLTIDYPEDLQVMQTVYNVIGYNNFDIDTLKTHFNSTLQNINEYNKLPDITVYTCVYNNEQTIAKTINSVLNQNFENFEYIVCDDGSTDNTREVLWNYIDDKRVKYIINKENFGLAFSANKVLLEAKGQYYVRLDADDEFIDNQSLDKLFYAINNNDYAICYSAFLTNRNSLPCSNRKEHHIGGAIINARIFHELKFNDKLRHWDGYDFYLRAREKFEIGYIEEPIWIYHYNDNSLSRNKNNVKERKKIKQELDNGTAFR